MAIIPFRGLAEKGIVHDANPYQLDLNAFSNGSNIRFHSNKAMRAPIWRAVETLTSPPLFCAGRRPSTGYDTVFIVGDNGHIFNYGSGSLPDVSPVSIEVPEDSQSYSYCFSGDVSYLNQPTVQPVYFGPSSTQFALLPGWDSSWRARVIRAFGDYLIALNVTKGNAATPSMVKWSDLVLAGQPPGSWNANDPTTSAGENILEDLDTPLVDGLAMRGVFVIYSENQIWQMVPIDNTLIFQFSRLFSEGGMLAPNCGVEVDGKHYVFGPTDIYVHDGSVKQSLIDKRNRDFVYRNIDVKNADVCFVQYMPQYDEIVFAYKTGDSDAAFQNTVRCNKGAVYNIPGDTWSFIDLPDVGAMTLANVDSVLTYANAGNVTYANVGGSYYDQENGYDAHVVGVSRSLGSQVTAPRLVAYDFMNKGSLSFPFLPEINGNAYVERIGLALDQVGSDLSTYKTIRRLFPLVSMFGNVPVSVQVGASMTPSGPVMWGIAQQFDPTSQYKVDVMTGGRYLAVRFTVSQAADFEVAGWDADVIPSGNW